MPSIKNNRDVTVFIPVGVNSYQEIGPGETAEVSQEIADQVDGEKGMKILADDTAPRRAPARRVDEEAGTTEVTVPTSTATPEPVIEATPAPKAMTKAKATESTAKAKATPKAPAGE